MVIVGMEYTSCGCSQQPVTKTIIDWHQTPEHLMLLVEQFIAALAIEDNESAGRHLRHLCAAGAAYSLSTDWMSGLGRLLRSNGLPHHAMLVEIKFPAAAGG